MDSVIVLLVWAALGLAVGAAAKWLMPGRDPPGGFVLTALLGIAGAVLGGYLASVVGLGSYSRFTLSGLVIAVLGAMLLLGGHRLVQSST
jgi:uncharacterized membrane protein YeaQ/YmgE (transglycosylase-associated protein family)